MKKIIEKYLLSIIICFLFIAAVPVAVSAQENTNTSTKNVFKELYMIRKNGPYGGELIWRCTPIDEENNIYVQNEVLSETVGVSGDAYSGGTFWYYGFSGTLSSDTAYISEMRQWENGKKITKESINTELAYCLPENTTYGTFSLNKGESLSKYPQYIREEGNVFHTEDSFPVFRAQVFDVIVCDKNEETHCTIITEVTDRNNEDYDDWTDTSMKGVRDHIDLYDGSDKQTKKIDKFSDKLTWSTGKRIFGLKNYKLEDRDVIEVPSDIHSIRMSYDNNYPEQENTNTYALSPDLPDITSVNDYSERQMIYYNYHFYRNKSKMVCINGGEWYQVHQTEKSPELKLRKGINIIFLSGTSPDQAEKSKR